MRQLPTLPPWHAHFVRRSRSRLSHTGRIGATVDRTSEAALGAASAADPFGSVVTQSHELAVVDFVGTLVVEAAIHYVDLTAHLLAAALADQAGLSVVRRTMEALLQAPLPSSWADHGVRPRAAADNSARCHPTRGPPPRG